MRRLKTPIIKDELHFKDTRVTEDNSYTVNILFFSLEA